jgi:hypothetical protein
MARRAPNPTEIFLEIFRGVPGSASQTPTFKYILQKRSDKLCPIAFFICSYSPKIGGRGADRLRHFSWMTNRKNGMTSNKYRRHNRLGSRHRR